MKVFKTLVFFDIADGSIHECDTIEYEGGKWLVTSWIDNPSKRETRPLRIIRVDQLGLQEFQGRFVLNYPMPKAVFDGRAPPPQGSPLVVIESPPITRFYDDSLH